MAKIELSKYNLKTKEIEKGLLRLSYKQSMVCLNNVNGDNKILKGLHECDVLAINKIGYATEYEIKISKADLRADIKKDHCHSNDLIKSTIFVVPFELLDFALENVPENFGVGYLDVSHYSDRDSFYLVTKRKPISNKNAVKWNQEQINKIYQKAYFRFLMDKIKD